MLTWASGRMYKPRGYRRRIDAGDLVSFEVIERETDLAILAASDVRAAAREAVLNCRADIEGYIARDKAFLTALGPLAARPDAPAIIKAMAEAASRAGVGPMAAVAGAVADHVGAALLAVTDEVIVENGGDIFFRTARARVAAVEAGEASPFAGKLAIELAPSEKGLGVCTSSGTVSHSLSFGAADAALILARTAALADAVATAAGNMVRAPGDISAAIDRARSIEGVLGVLILAGSKMGTWGQIQLV